MTLQRPGRLMIPEMTVRVPSVAFSMIVSVLISGCGSDPGSEESGVRLPPAYAEDATCANCHRQEAGDWEGSHHDLAMQEVSPEAVLGDFDSTFTHFGVTSRFWTDGDRYLVNTEGPDGELSDFEIAYTFGVEPLQQYLIEFPDGRLQALGVAWDTEREEWFHLYPDDRIPPGDPLHWTGPYQNWNTMCAECHSTDLRKNYDPETRSYDVSWEAVDVGCQACHGPAADHVAWAIDAGNVGPGEVPASELRLVTDFREGGAGKQIESCAPCHSRRRPVSANDVAGESFLDHFVPETLREDLYHADGQISEEVYVYGSFLQSRMYAEGVACTDCHNPHSLDLIVLGNSLCEQCHHPEGPIARFPTLTLKDYDSPDHHFHPTDTAGAQCVNCHMPERTYMVVDPRRDHSFRVPRPDLSVRIGTPNACNDCHSDQTVEWAADAVAEWYGPERRQGTHYGEAIAAGRSGDVESVSALSELSMNPEVSAIVRATALDLLGRYGEPALPALSAAVGTPDPLLRVTAATVLERYSLLERSRRLPPLLRDPVRSVRLEAARVLAPVPRQAIAVEDRQLLNDLITEYEDVQLSLADTAPAHLNLAVLHTVAGDVQRAISDYETALELQPDFTPASLNLATLLSQLGRNPDAYLVLRDAVAQHPEEGEVHYSMGLLLAEMGQIEVATGSLGRASALLPDRSRVHYNYALALQQTGSRSDAEAEFIEANRLDPSDAEVLRALALLYAEEGRWNEALDRAEKLVEMLPGDGTALQLLASIRRNSQSR